MPHKHKKKTRATKAQTTFKPVDPEVLFYIKLINKIRRSKDEVQVNDAFTQVIQGLDAKIKKICSRYRIPGHDFDDIYAEALYALRYKAIKDYDQERGSGEGPAAFDRFALLCIRRHLATTLKTSHQNRKKILNGCKSLDQDRSSDNEDLSIVNILPASNGDISVEVQQSEEFKSLVNHLLKKLSKFEKSVFYLYARQYTYEEIAEIINRKFPQKDVVDIKGVDNALSRIKNKGKSVLKHVDKHMFKRVDNALQRIKKKAREDV
jgi:RNA polymerase sporulation-specific sigma factor